MLGWFRRTVDRIVLRDRQYRFLFRHDDSGEAVSLDCETTGFDPWVDDIVSVAAIRIRGSRILASSAFRAVVRPEATMRASAIKVHQLRAQDVAEGRPIGDVLPELLRFIGARPLVGYWIAFDVSMLNKYLIEMLNIHLPNPLIDVSELYYDRKYGNAPPGTAIDLRYATILDDLGLPALPQHDAMNDALGAAEMYVMLEDMRARGIRIPRRRDGAGFNAFAAA
jgi:DNA polymerase-3 subunit epsilon